MEASTITPDNAERVVKALAHGVPAAELAMAPRAADGIDALLTTPALLRELRCVSEELPPGTSRQAQADHVWLQLFVHRTPLSDPCRRVLTLFNKLGFRDHVQTRSLVAIRKSAAALPPGAWEAQVRQLAHLQAAILAVPVERPGAPDPDPSSDPRAPYALVVACPTPGSGQDIDAARAAASGAPHHVRVHAAPGAPLDGVLEAVRALRCPLWMVVDDLAAVPPPERLAGVPLWVSCPHRALPELCHRYPWAVPVNASPKSSDIYAFTRQGLELRGAHFVAYTSLGVDGSLEHVASGWCHARAALARVLTERYRCLLHAGWNLSASEIAEDMAQLAGCAVTPGTGAGAAPPQTPPPPSPASA